MAQGRFTKIISMIKWIRTSRLSIMSSLYLQRTEFSERNMAVTVTSPKAHAIASDLWKPEPCTVTCIGTRVMDTTSGGTRGVEVSYERGTPVTRFGSDLCPVAWSNRAPSPQSGHDCRPLKSTQQTLKNLSKSTNRTVNARVSK